VKVLFYGRLAEAIGPELEVDVLAGCSIAELRGKLIAEHPEIEEVLRSRRARACVRQAVVNDDYRLVGGDTLEFLPPVSGG
jgi:molybdopterin converting factor small subunit